MSPHPARPLQPDLTTVESYEPTGDSVLEMKSLLPFARNASAASYTYSDSSESVSDRPQEDTPKAAESASSSTCQVSFQNATLRQAALSDSPDRNGLLQDDENHAQVEEQVQKRFSFQRRVTALLACEPLLLATIFGVVLGVLAGSLIRLGKPSSKAIDLVGKHMTKDGKVKGQPVFICYSKLAC